MQVRLLNVDLIRRFGGVIKNVDSSMAALWIKKGLAKEEKNDLDRVQDLLNFSGITSDTEENLKKKMLSEYIFPDLIIMN